MNSKTNHGSTASFIVHRFLLSLIKKNMFYEIAPWWRHQIPLTKGETWSFDVFFDLRLNNGWVNNGEAGDLRRHSAHYDVTVMATAILWNAARGIFPRQSVCHYSYNKWNGDIIGNDLREGSFLWWLQGETFSIQFTMWSFSAQYS